MRPHSSPILTNKAKSKPKNDEKRRKQLLQTQRSQLRDYDGKKVQEKVQVRECGVQVAETVSQMGNAKALLDQPYL
jgi:hypothetical protein